MGTQTGGVPSKTSPEHVMLSDVLPRGFENKNGWVSKKEGNIDNFDGLPLRI